MTEINLLRKYLKEKNLLRSYNRFRNSQSLKKVRVEIVQDDIRQSIIAIKRKNSVELVDEFTYETLATTKKYKLDEIQSILNQKRTVKRNILGKASVEVEQPIIKLKELHRKPLSNLIQIIKQRPYPKSFKINSRAVQGQLSMKVLFKGDKKEDKIIVEGTSKQRLLHIKKEQDRATIEAFRSAFSQVQFSIKDFKILYIHYIYYQDKKPIQPVFDRLFTKELAGKGRQQRAI